MWSIKLRPKHCAACRVSLVSPSPDVKVDLISQAAGLSFSILRHAARPLPRASFLLSIFIWVIAREHQGQTVFFFTESFLASSESFRSLRGHRVKTYEKTGPNEDWVPARLHLCQFLLNWSGLSFLMPVLCFRPQTEPESRRQEHTLSSSSALVAFRKKCASKVQFKSSAVTLTPFKQTRRLMSN